MRMLPHGIQPTRATGCICRSCIRASRPSERARVVVLTAVRICLCLLERHRYQLDPMPRRGVRAEGTPRMRRGASKGGYLRKPRGCEGDLEGPWSVLSGNLQTLHQREQYLRFQGHFRLQGNCVFRETRVSITFIRERRYIKWLSRRRRFRLR